MTERTQDQILDEMVHAVACVARHYGDRLRESDLKLIRDRLDLNWYTDAGFSGDCRESDRYIDFHQRIIWPDGWDRLIPLQTGREA